MQRTMIGHAVVIGDEICSAGPAEESNYQVLCIHPSDVPAEKIADELELATHSVGQKIMKVTITWDDEKDALAK